MVNDELRKKKEILTYKTGAKFVKHDGVAVNATRPVSMGMAPAAAAAVAGTSNGDGVRVESPRLTSARSGELNSYP